MIRRVEKTIPTFTSFCFIRVIRVEHTHSHFCCINIHSFLFCLIYLGSWSDSRCFKFVCKLILTRLIFRVINCIDLSFQHNKNVLWALMSHFKMPRNQDSTLIHFFPLLKTHEQWIIPHFQGRLNRLSCHL